MGYEKFDIITLGNKTKLIVLEKIEYEGNVYLYVDKVNDNETDTYGEYHVMRVCEGNIVQKETNVDILTNILPLFSKNIRLNND